MKVLQSTLSSQHLSGTEGMGSEEWRQVFEQKSQRAVRGLRGVRFFRLKPPRKQNPTRPQALLGSRCQHGDLHG